MAQRPIGTKVQRKSRKGSVGERERGRLGELEKLQIKFHYRKDQLVGLTGKIDSRYFR